MLYLNFDPAAYFFPTFPSHSTKFFIAKISVKLHSFLLQISQACATLADSYLKYKAGEKKTSES